MCITDRLVIMAALVADVDIIFFALWFLLLSSFFPRLISAVAEWMSTILLSSLI